MDLKFNYKTLYFFLLSFFGIIIILGLSGTINNKSAFNYSIFGLISSLIIWLIDEFINHESEERIYSGTYDSAADDTEIHKILKKRLWWFTAYLILLIVVFLFLILFE